MATSVLKSQDKIIDEDRKPGVVYIGHVPHGFYEKQLRSYFSQFGDVLSVKLSRSMKSGKSKGYAFIKFRYAAVAKTVADTCHNYLFFNKLLKCEYKPLSEVHKDTFFSYKWRMNNKQKRQHNSSKTEDKLKQSLQRSASCKQKKLNKLKELGVDLKLDDVMNVPEAAKKVPRSKREVKEKASEEVENGGSAKASSSPKLVKKVNKNGMKKKKTKTPGTPKLLKTSSHTTISNVKVKKVKVSASTQSLVAPSTSTKKSVAPKSKKASKVPSPGVRERKLKPPPAKRAKKE